MIKNSDKNEIKDKYLDPDNTPDIMDRLRLSSTLGQVKTLIDEVFPDWIVTTMNTYCSDYPHLTENWYKVCQMTNSKPTQIMIVEEIFEDNTIYSLISIFAECFTRAGFSVRRKREYIPCEKCNSAIPNYSLWQLFKDNGIKVPEVWDVKCSGCK